MAHGGRRPGAGRKKGSKTTEPVKKTREIAKRYVRSGKVTPLDVLLTAMERSFKADDLETAGRFAEKAAPYCHARLSSVEHKKPPIDLSKLTDDELAQFRELYRRAGASDAREAGNGMAPPAGTAIPGANGTRH